MSQPTVEPKEDAASAAPAARPDEAPRRWRCGRCGEALEVESVPTRYAHGGLLLQLERCPVCGLTLVRKSLAEGRMVDMQKRMEETWNGV